MCKAKVNPRNTYRVTYGASRGKQRTVELPDAKARELQKKRYNVLDDGVRDAIHSIPIRSALGSKLDLLMRHLLYIEKTQPKSKSLVFTAFSRGITLVGNALRLNGIRFVSVEGGSQRAAKAVDSFKNDPDVNVLLLHSEAQSSGLNLVCAQNIFLLEPLVNHAIELQAIGRVHRIGQTKKTNVFCYQVNDTVEEQVVNLARARRQSLFTKENSVSHDLQDSAEMSAMARVHPARTAGQSREGEFVADIAELIECLADIETHTEEEEQQGVHQELIGKAESTSTNERERMRQERLRAIEMRQAVASLEAERRR